MELFLVTNTLKTLLTFFAIVAGTFVIVTKNAIISVFNLIVLYILVAFYLIYIGITYLGISYIVVYIGAIAILFLFVIMMIDVEVVEKRNNSYLPLLFLLLGGFLLTVREILYNLGVIKIKSFLEKKKEKYLINDNSENIFNFIDSDIKSLDKIDISILKYTTYDSKGIFFNLINNRVTEENNILKEKTEYISNIKDNSAFFYNYNNELYNNNYLLIFPDWNSAANRATQISAIGDVLYTVYHSYIYIVSIILLLAMLGAIILTGDSYNSTKVINIEKNKNSSIFLLLYSFTKIISVSLKILIFISLNLLNEWNKYFFTYYYYFCISVSIIYNNIKNNLLCKWLYIKKYIKIYRNKREDEYYKKKYKIINNISPFLSGLNGEIRQSEGIIGNLLYYIIANIFIGLLLLLINSYFSLSVKYLEKGGGFECGFTSFVQTRERFNVIFYRVSLLFLVFDLEIILAFPYPAIYQKNENISKNNVLVFLYILVIGFIYELKEGALNIVKKAHPTEINIGK